ncbi:MAG: hypothetical protein ACJ762_10320 [Solirubrobacteraceae bacterium]
MPVPRMARTAAALLALVAVPSLGATALAGDGDLDAALGTGGVVLTPLGDDASGGHVSVDSSGRYVVAATITSGGVRQPALVRYAAGIPDLTFNSTGRVVLSGLAQATADAALARDIPINAGTPRIVVAGGQGASWFVTRLSDNGTVDWTTTIPLPDVSVVAAHVGGFTMDAAGTITIAGWGDTSVGGARGYMVQLDASGASAPLTLPTPTLVNGSGDTRLRAIGEVGSDFYVAGSVKAGSATRTFVSRRDATLVSVWEQERPIGSGGDSTAYDVQATPGAGPGDAIVVGQALDSGNRRAVIARYAVSNGAPAYERMITAGNGGDATASAVRLTATTGVLAGSALQDGSRRVMPTACSWPAAATTLPSPGARPARPVRCSSAPGTAGRPRPPASRRTPRRDSPSWPAQRAAVAPLTRSCSPGSPRPPRTPPCRSPTATRTPTSPTTRASS